jgi:hypothetical protein
MNPEPRPWRITVVLALAAFTAGYLANRTLAIRDESAQRLPAMRDGVQASRKVPGQTHVEYDNLRSGRLLSALLEASRDSDDQSRSQRFYLAAAGIGPLEIARALDLAYHMAYRERHELISILIARWADFDPHAAAEYALEHRPVHPNAQRELLGQVLSAWAQKDEAAAKAWALALKNPIQRRQAIAGLMEGIAQTDAPRAIALIKDLPAYYQGDALYRAALTWAARDPAAVADLIAHRPTDVPYYGIMMQLASNWAVADPPTAMAWAGRIADAGMRQTAQTAIFSALVVTDPQAVASGILRMPPGEGRDLAIKKVREYASSEPQAVVDFALALPPGHDRMQTLATAIEQLATSSPEKAIAALDQCTAELGNDQQKEWLTTSIARSWTSKNREAAVNWIEHLEPGAAQDGSFATAALTLILDDPNASLDLGSKIQDGTRREKTMRQSFQAWNTRDAGAARAWLEKADVPAEWKTSWMAPPKPPEEK